MSASRLIHLRRALIVLCALAAVWALIVTVTDGFHLRLGPLRISSRNPRHPFVVAALSGAAALLLLVHRSTRTTVRDEAAWWMRLAAPALTPLRHLAGITVVPSVLIAVLVSGLDVAQWLIGVPLWLDEEMIALNIRDRGFLDLGGRLWLGQSAPLGWLVVQRAIVLAFGPSEIALRFLPLVFGIATTIAAVWIGQRWLGRAGSALLVTLCAAGQWLSFNRFEVKHYSADAFWGLLLPALGVWALEDESESGSRRRWTWWWIAAAAGLWFANGALLVAPACALFLAAAIFRRHGLRPAMVFAAIGLVWLASFASNWDVSLQYTHNNNYLRTYWAEQVLPASAGLLDVPGWIAARFEPLANNPAGTQLALTLWLCALGGFLFSRAPPLGIAFGLVVLSAFGFAVLRFVPLHDRLALWIVPGLYVGVALLADRAVRQGAEAWNRRRWTRLVVSAVAIGACIHLGVSVVGNGKWRVDLGMPGDSNHGIDDRSGVRWLMAQRKRGDALISTKLAWPAMWWYGGIPIDRAAPAGRLPDGAVMYQVADGRWRPECVEQFRDSLRDHQRVLAYVGFPDHPEGFDRLLLHYLQQAGTVSRIQRFADLSMAAVVDLHPGPRSAADVSPVPPAPPGSSLGGCLAVQPARRW